jgi:hypothetical protein
MGLRPTRMAGTNQLIRAVPTFGTARMLPEFRPPNLDHAIHSVNKDMKDHPVRPISSTCWYNWYDDCFVTEPLYRRIAQDLRRRIRSGDLPPGRRLLTEPELTKLYSASRNTVRDAIKWLTANGLVETRPGQGTFVAKRITPFVTTLSPDPETGLGGGEGEAAFVEIRERGREPSRSVPRVQVRAAAGYQASTEVPIPFRVTFHRPASRPEPAGHQLRRGPPRPAPSRRSFPSGIRPP